MDFIDQNLGIQGQSHDFLQRIKGFVASFVSEDQNFILRVYKAIDEILSVRIEQNRNNFCLRNEIRESEEFLEFYCFIDRRNWV